MPGGVAPPAVRNQAPERLGRYEITEPIAKRYEPVDIHRADEVRRMRAGREGKAWVALEYVNVRVNQQRRVVSHPFGRGRRKDGATHSVVLRFGRE